MSKTPLPYHAGDISTLARSLRRQLGGFDHTPSHVEMLNLLAKAGGYRNFQHYRSAVLPAQTSREAVPEINRKHVKILMRHLDGEKRLIRWPKKFSIRMLGLWVMWSRIPANEPMTEIDINTLLRENHLFDDHALLRRELVDRGMVDRTADGRSYTRIERQPPVDALEVFRQIRS